MDPVEITIDHELFRVSERREPGARLSYDFAWLNGPADGTYGFTAALGDIDPADPLDRLTDEARLFVTAFYGRGGIGETDFPGHVSARERLRG